MLLSVSHAQSLTQADFTGTVTVFNSSGGTISALATNLVRPSAWNSQHSVAGTLQAADMASLLTVAANGMTMTTSTNGITIGNLDAEFYEPFVFAATNSTATNPGIGTWYVDPFQMPQWIESGRLNMFVAMTSASVFGNASNFSFSQSGSATRYQTMNNKLALYSLDAGANSTRLVSFWSGDCSMMFTHNLAVTTASTTATGSSSLTLSNAATVSMPVQWDVSGNVTYSTFTGSGTLSTSGTSNVTTVNSTFGTSLVSAVANYVTGSRMDIVGFNTTLGPGVFYIGNMFSSTSSTTGTNYGAGTVMQTMSRIGMLGFNDGAFKQVGKSTTNSSTNELPFHGFITTVSSAPFSTLGTSDMRATNWRMYWNHMEDVLS